MHHVQRIALTPCIWQGALTDDQTRQALSGGRVMVRSLRTFSFDGCLFSQFITHIIIVQAYLLTERIFHPYPLQSSHFLHHIPYLQCVRQRPHALYL